LLLLSTGERRRHPGRRKVGDGLAGADLGTMRRRCKLAGSYPPNSVWALNRTVNAPLIVIPGLKNGSGLEFSAWIGFGATRSADALELRWNWQPPPLVSAGAGGLPQMRGLAGWACRATKTSAGCVLFL